MRSSSQHVIARRIAANLFDTTIEIFGGLLGSYFGMMVAALLESVKDGPAEQIQHSMWSGFGFGLTFWTISISFLNRVLIQGLSRSTVGKKMLRLELISTHEALTWSTILARWIMAFGSFAIGGAGYWVALFNKDGRTYHDVVSNTDVVPAYQSATISVEAQDSSHVSNLVVLPGFQTSPANELQVISHADTSSEMQLSSPAPEHVVEAITVEHDKKKAA